MHGEKMQCRICQSEMQIFETLPSAAVEVAQLYNKPTMGKGSDITLYHCSTCDHYQILYINNDCYYEDYIMTVSHSPKIRDLQLNQAKMLNSFAKNKRSFMEVGCGDGAFLQKVAEFFEKTVGIEPSKTYCEMCKRKGLTVINNYPNDEFKYEEKFDAFVARQVFEHLENPLEVMNAIYRQLNDEAIGLIEVPNAQKMILENRYFDLFSDHVNYYTPLSLSYLAKNTGFNVICVKESFNRDYLEIYLKKESRRVNLNKTRERDVEFIIDHCNKFNSVSVWGAGAKAQAIMTVLGREITLKHIFDSDPNKENKFLINSQRSIEMPNRENINENDLIIIFAVSYTEEIVKLLKEDYKFTRHIITLEKEPCLLKI